MTQTALPFSKVIKRDGRIVPFDQEKITNAIFAAARAAGGKDRKKAEELSNLVVKKLRQTIKKGYPSIEEIQDVVEKVLIETGHARTAKAYISYRQKRAEIRLEKQRILEKDFVDEIDKKFDLNALRVLKSRYLRKNENGALIESPKELFTRVAVHVMLPEILYSKEVYSKGNRQKKHTTERFDAAKYDGKYSIGKFKLNQFHLEALKRMYDRFNKEGKMKLSWTQLLSRINAGKFDRFEVTAQEFFDLMVSKNFLPNTPALANFGNPLGMGSACFVSDIGDSLEEIMDTLKKTALVFKAGGGMGYNFSKIRPEGDFVSSTHGIASGPLSFMRLFDSMTEVIKQGGIRRGASMGILNSNHPDIEKFIRAKEGNKALRNFNISVLVMPEFWDYLKHNKPYPLINPRTGTVVRTVNARMLFDLIAHHAWESAEPGVIYFDNINKFNPLLEYLGPIVATNPCGEVKLYPNESCNLGSINVWNFVHENEKGEMVFDWDALAKVVHLSTRFLDNVIEVNKFPLKEIEEMTLSTRKIGLGIMGLADLLYDLKISYESEAGLKFMEKLMEFINYHSKLESIELAKSRGKFPLFDKSFYPKGKMPFKGFYEKKKHNLEWNKIVKEIKKHGLRNCFTTVIAPTGSISMIAGCSSGIEPVYSLVFEKHVKVGNFYYVNPVFEKVMSEEGLFDDDLLEDIVRCRGSVKNLGYIPPKFKKLFVTAHDISPEGHIRALAAFQNWTDSSISKTINFPANATVEEVKKCYILAHDLGCKDVTVYRDTSIKDQVLVTQKKKKQKGKQLIAAYTDEERPTETIEAPQTPADNGTILSQPSEASETVQERCPNDNTPLIMKEGCMICPICGWGKCSG